MMVYEQFNMQLGKLYKIFYKTSFHCYCRYNVMTVVVGSMSHVLTWSIVNCPHQQNSAALNAKILQNFLLSINNKTCI